MHHKAWRARARCAGHAEIMFDPTRTDEALSRCAGCPVAEQCLTATMAAEAGEPYRYGVAGGYGPLDRERMAGGETPVRHRQPARPKTQYRRRRKCKGCKATIRQPNVGPLRLWCSGACWRQANAKRRAAIKRDRWAADRDRQREAAAARKRSEWERLSEEAKEMRRAAMRVDRLSPEQRSARNARKRAARAVEGEGQVHRGLSAGAGGQRPRGLAGDRRQGQGQAEHDALLPAGAGAGEVLGGGSVRGRSGDGQLPSGGVGQ